MTLSPYQLYLINAKHSAVSEHFTLYDISHSDTALAKDIDNRPSADIVANAKALITNIMEPIRNHFNKPVTVDCIYRCPALNKAVGGVPTSQHVKGQACDFVISGLALPVIFNYIKENLNFDQVIYEGTWIHVSYSATHNRKQALAYKNGKYIAA